MSKKNARAGGKFNGNHTSLIPLAALVCDIAHQFATVTKISPGFIKAGLPSVRGKRRMKMTKKDGALLLSIRDNTSHQEVYIYTSDTESTQRAITGEVKKHHVLITYT